MRRIHWLASWLPFFLTLLVGIAEAQTGGNVRLQIRLRYSDGTAVTGETIILQRLPEEEPVLPKCETNANGECNWSVNRGLYQLLFTRPLDNISSLAVAEGGLRGFGITVGDDPLTYDFTFHSDGGVYFDAAPEADVPSPIIPNEDDLHSGLAPTPPIENEQIPATATPELTRMPETAVASPANSTWRTLLLIGCGFLIGGGLHIFSRRRSMKNYQSEGCDA